MQHRLSLSLNGVYSIKGTIWSRPLNRNSNLENRAHPDNFLFQNRKNRGAAKVGNITNDIDFSLTKLSQLSNHHFQEGYSIKGKIYRAVVVEPEESHHTRILGRNG